MEYQLKLLKLFNNEGFSKVVDLLDELLNNEEILLNFLILNMNNINNIKYLCNYLKNDVNKYRNVINNIISHKDILYENKEIFILNIFDKYNENNLISFEDEYINIFMKNIRQNNIYSMILFEKYEELNDVLVYKILSNNIFENEVYKNTEDYYNNYSNYFGNIISNMLDKDENMFMDWMYNISYIYNYRCKTISKLKLNDNILFILLDSVINKYNLIKSENNYTNSTIFDFIEKNVDLLNIKYEDVSAYEKNVAYEILILKLIHITIPSSLDDIEHNNNIIADYNYYIDTVSDDNNILHNFDIIKKYVIGNNKKVIEKYIKKNNEMYNKLNKYIMENIYEYYVNLIHIIKTRDYNIENNELFSTIIINIIDFYIFYYNNYTYVYKDLNEKYELFKFFADIFNNKCSNINIDIKLVDFFNKIYSNESVYITGNKNNIDIVELLDKSFMFYLHLDSYDDYSKNNIKYKMVCIYNSIFNAPYILHSNMCTIMEKKSNVSKFLISFMEDINIFMNNFMIYYRLFQTNKDYSTIANTYYIYIEDYIRFYKYILRKHKSNIDKDIISISLHKLNKNIIKMNELCKDKNNVYKIILYIIDIYILLEEEDYQIMKNDTRSFDYEVFMNIYDNLVNIHKHKNVLLFYEFITDVNELTVTSEEEYDNIPDEFLDPLYNTLIEEPVLLPSSGNCVDFNVIKKHLLYHNFDPFNRDELTLDKLEEYNNNADIKKQNELFKKKIDDWKKENTNN